MTTDVNQVESKLLKLISQYCEVHKKGPWIVHWSKDKDSRRSWYCPKMLQRTTSTMCHEKKRSSKSSSDYRKKELLNGPVQFLEWATLNVPILTSWTCFKHISSAKAGLRPKKEKCPFTETLVTYLGHPVSKEGIQPTEDRVKAITSAPLPQTM